jgi:hypothetical protein
MRMHSWNDNYCDANIQGRTCTLPAGFRTPHPGAGKCFHHEYSDKKPIPHESEKLLGRSCFCKSIYEKYALTYLDQDEKVVEYGYETLQIPYYFVDSNLTYTPDLLVTYLDGKKVIVEIKTKGEIDSQNEQNYEKFKSADLYAKEHGLEFIIWIYDYTKESGTLFPNELVKSGAFLPKVD